MSSDPAGADRWTCRRIREWPAGGNPGKWIAEQDIRQFLGWVRGRHAGVSRELGSSLRLITFAHGERGIIDFRSEIDPVSATHDYLA